MSMSISQRHATNGTENQKITMAKRRFCLWLLFIMLFIGWGVYTYFKQTNTMEHLQQELKQKETEKKKVEQVYYELQQEISRLQTTEYILQIARSRGMVLPNELLIRNHKE